MFAKLKKDHYPGLAKRIFFVRAPKVFMMAWKIAQHFYDRRIHNKFIFAGHDEYVDVLSEYMDLEVLPTVLYEDGKGQPLGWFEKVHMEGGFLPAEVKG